MLPMTVELTRGVAAIPHDLDAVLAELDTPEYAIEEVQREACRLTNSREALAIVIDWRSGEAWSVHGRITSAALRDAAMEVAASGRRELIGCTAIEPLGKRAVLVVRRLATTYAADDLVGLNRLASRVERLLG